MWFLRQDIDRVRSQPAAEVCDWYESLLGPAQTVMDVALLSTERMAECLFALGKRRLR